MDETTALQPCPFCGSAADVYNDDWSERVRVFCSDAECTGTAWCDTEAEAANAWNTRTRLTSAEQALIDAARAYTAVYAQSGTTKPTTATERAIDTLCAAARRLAEEQ